MMSFHPTSRELFNRRPMPITKKLPKIIHSRRPVAARASLSGLLFAGCSATKRLAHDLGFGRNLGCTALYRIQNCKWSETYHGSLRSNLCFSVLVVPIYSPR